MKKFLSILFNPGDDKNIGFLILRVLLGLGFIRHGYPKFFVMWDGFIGFLTSKGLILPKILGFFSAFGEFVGGICLVFGLLSRFFSLINTIAMTVAVIFIHMGDPIDKREIAFLYLFISLLYVLKGSGNYSVDNFIYKKINK